MGQFRRKSKHCKLCGKIAKGYEEKETDVNIAIELLSQAVSGSYDVAFILTGDSDLLPAIRAVKSSFPAKEIVVVFPPGSKTESLKAESHRHIRIKRHHLVNHQLPPTIKVDGLEIKKPAPW